ncbi:MULTISPECIES: DUF5085 family protein [Staphylococcus]|nr:MULTISPECIES: DUF5085 family protein [Staphylococcus]KXA41992.1 hypothetical protein HMPREF3215_02269 [Staphylococcus simulans]UXR37772.1 DUF5085 family protein [Staphylococcus simulans]
MLEGRLKINQYETEEKEVLAEIEGFAKNINFNLYHRIITLFTKWMT